MHVLDILLASEQNISCQQSITDKWNYDTIANTHWNYMYYMYMEGASQYYIIQKKGRDLIPSCTTYITHPWILCDLPSLWSIPFYSEAHD